MRWYNTENERRQPVVKYRVRELMEKFFKAYMNERNLEKTLELVSDEIVSLGTGVQETARNKEEFRKLLSEEFAVSPKPVFFLIDEYTETVAHSQVCSVFCCVTARAEGEHGDFFSLKTRLTATCCQENGEWKILSLHMSIPTDLQEDEEFFPLKYGHEVLKKLSSQSNRELIRLMTNTFPGGIIGGYLEDGFPLYIINDEMLDYLGYTYEEMIRETGERVIETIAPEDRERVENYVLEEIRKKGGYEVQYRLLKRNGERMWVLDKGRKVITDEGRAAIVSVVIDISESIRRQEKLRKEAEQDSLTGILNRKEAIRRMEKSFVEKPEGVLFVMDIDNFKMLNDTCGHLEGDQVLVEFAKILRRCSRQDDICARLGGDEFLVYFPGFASREKVAERAGKIQEQFLVYARKKYADLSLSVSIGIVLRVGCGDFETLYRNADKALYQAKRSEKGSYVFAE